MTPVPQLHELLTRLADYGINGIADSERYKVAECIEVMDRQRGHIQRLEAACRDAEEDGKTRYAQLHARYLTLERACREKDEHRDYLVGRIIQEQSYCDNRGLHARIAELERQCREKDEEYLQLGLRRAELFADQAKRIAELEAALREETKKA